MMKVDDTVLPDVLAPSLAVVFCGTAAGNKSAETRTYYAHTTNKFWKILNESGLTPVTFSPLEFRKVNKHGIGLTDLAKKASGPDSTLKKSDFDVSGFEAKIEKYQPVFVGFNGKRAAREFLGIHQIEYGLQNRPIGKTRLFVLPSTSALADRYWDPIHWFSLADQVLRSRELSPIRSMNGPVNQQKPPLKKL